MLLSSYLWTSLLHYYPRALLLWSLHRYLSFLSQYLIILLLAFWRFTWPSFAYLSLLLCLPELLPVCCSTVLFPLWGMLLSSPSFFGIYIISTCLRSPSILYFPSYGIFSVCTFYISHIILLPPLYTTLALTDMPHLGCPLHSAFVLSIVGHTLDFFFTSFAILLMAWSHMLFSLLLASSFFPSKENTSCTCVLSFHIWNTLLPLFLVSLLSFLLSHIALLYLTIPQIYSERLIFSFLLLFDSCSFRPGAWTSCNTNIFFSFVLSILLLI